MAERDDLGPEQQAEPERFVIVPTLPAWQELLARVRELEQRGIPPQPAPASTVGDAAGLARRLDRHRQELEDLKRWANDLIRLLEPYFPGAVPAVPKGDDYL